MSEIANSDPANLDSYQAFREQGGKTHYISLARKIPPIPT